MTTMKQEAASINHQYLKTKEVPIFNNIGRTYIQKDKYTHE